MTAMGMILGTAAYMSPEQAKGRQADKRSDVWAFGAVLYEMLSGQRAFKGDDVSDTLAAVLRQDVDWTALPASTPAPVRRLIARCLDRDVKRRLRDIGEARIVAGRARCADERQRKRRRHPASAATAVAPRHCQPCSPRSWSVDWPEPRRGTSSPPPRLRSLDSNYLLPEGLSLTGLASRMVDISPDGAQLVYVADGRLYLRVMSEQDATAIQGTEGYQAVTSPVFSPDGRSIAFHASSDQTLKRIAATGGAAVTICPAAIPFGMSWGADGIVFSEGSKGIMHVSPNGGTPNVLVSLKDGEVSVSPQMLPGGQYLLFTVATGTAPNRWDSAHIVAQSIATGERKIIIKGGADARYLPTGHLVYAVGGSVVAVAFDVKNLEATGSPVPMVAGVARPSAGNGIANFSLSGNGTLVYIPGTTTLSAGQIAVALTDRRRVLRIAEAPGRCVRGTTRRS